MEPDIGSTKSDEGGLDSTKQGDTTPIPEPVVSEESVSVDPLDKGGEGDLIPPPESPTETPPNQIIETQREEVEIPPAVNPPDKGVVSQRTGGLSSSLLAEYRARSIISRHARQRAKLDKIITLARKRTTPLTNRLVTLHLRIHPATASRFLATLVKEGRLKKVPNQNRRNTAYILG